MPKTTEQRRQAVARLDRCDQVAWPAALAGDPAAARTVQAVIEHRARLFGL